jgi:hypothetical protein
MTNMDKKKIIGAILAANFYAVELVLAKVEMKLCG